LKRIKELVTLGSGDLIGTSLSAIFWFFLAAQIKPDEYGQLQWFISIAGILSSVALIANTSTLTVYVAKKIPIQSTLNVISLLFSLILALIVIIFLPSFHIIDSGVLLIAYVINSLVVGDILGKKHFRDHGILTVVQKGLTCGLGFLFYYLFGYEAVIFALIISYILHYKRLVSLFKEVKIDLKLLKQKKEFIFSNYLNSSILVGTVGAGHIDKIIITPLLGYAVLGNYSLGMQIIAIMMIFTNIVYKFMLSYDSTNSNLRNLKILVVLLSIFLALTGFFLGPIIIEIYFPNYADIKTAIEVMSLNIIPATVGLIFQSKLLSQEKSRQVLIGTLASVVGLTIGMIILGPILGMIGLAYSLISSSIIKVIIFGIMVRNSHLRRI